MGAAGTRLKPDDHPAIRAEGLVKRFGGVRALDGVDVDLAPGNTLVLLGPNGAGKTTAVRILSTLLPPDGGRAWVCGFDVERQAGQVRRLIGLSGQYAAVDAYLTGRENLRMIGGLYGLGRHEARVRTDELLERLDLTGAAHRIARTYSGGMRRRLDIAASLVAAPRVLFLDEPTTGLDPHGRIAVWELLEQLTAHGTSLLLTTQYMEEADRLADEVVVLGNGRVIAQGTPHQLKARIGGYRLELESPPNEDPRALVGALSGWGAAQPIVDLAARRVILPVDDGLALVPELRARLDGAGLRVADLTLRRPALDDVFLTLTGKLVHEASVPDKSAPDASPEPKPVEASLGHGARGGAAIERLQVVTPGHPLRNVGIVIVRNLRRLVRVPTLIAFATVQPALFVLLFTYVFGGAVDPAGAEHYIDYVLPGLFVLAIGFGASQTGVAIAEDLSSGMIDRFRSLPISNVSLPAGRVLADAIRNLFVVGLMIALGSTLGFRFHAGPAAAVAVVALAVAIGLAFSWLNLLLGLLVRDAESAGLAGLFPVIILIFTSSTLVPIVTMPGWLQAFAKVNPITIVVDALRVLIIGGPTSKPVVQALAWVVGLLAVTAPTAVARYRRTTAA